ncbi:MULTISPECIES: SPFH domain-containing protein [unclassified Campylobacter]|uniref:SPFH domain-containing protein n=1 Tax=unclassified Campylobacter TaxID=2593542 RepID=UPI001BD93195|nr:MULTISPECIES: SPFH domain-containing protein [unclassified Campylobacter]MBZ7976626.1 prohibitin family protein [Campylobacter sp. RM12637]MBZ7978639.1 prohibitin family protein [Campylobacter sp. RM12654]MBZ7980704.1 prohibitin family protein [Campylobacter sp. RM12642]MBZ7982558.1 prohibitin family protein [Campylobacter sp. RM12640]MBZ7984604.1 prohibitin family protein [Campylobacter sp. RM12647]MBZ7989797.1 prohibitin family protein [Campylobacter sp. RM12635]MBZ7993262.1 prohibitin 
MPADLNDYFNKNKKNDNKKTDFNIDFNFKGFGKFNGVIIAAVVIFLIVVIAKPFVVVNSGQVGIRSTTGKYDPIALQPGFHFIIPYFQKVLIVDTKVRQINYASVEGASERTYGRESIINKESITVVDARNLPVSVDITVQYRLDASNAPQTIAQWGLDWENKIIDPVILEVVRSVVGKYTAEELPIKRNEIAASIELESRKSIDAQDNKPVLLESVKLRGIILPTNVKEQIEKVQIAKQEAERTKYEVERANQEALKKAALAEGIAKAAIIEAQGKADAQKIEADAQAYANREIAKSISKELLELKQIETQKEFNEALKVNNDAKIFLTPGGAVPNIWLDNASTKKTTSLNN